MTTKAALFLGLAGAALLFLSRQPTSSGDSIVEPIKAMLTGPRGLRNNNPGNIVRTQDKWRGASRDQSADSRFVVFDSPVWGLRALARVLRGYVAGGHNSIAKIISRWAPVNENNTAAYVQAVSRSMGVGAAAPLALDDATMARLMAAIVQHENGRQPFDSATFQKAIELERSA